MVTSQTADREISTVINLTRKNHTDAGVVLTSNVRQVVQERPIYERQSVKASTGAESTFTMTHSLTISECENSILVAKTMIKVLTHFY